MNLKFLKNFSLKKCKGMCWNNGDISRQAKLSGHFSKILPVSIRMEFLKQGRLTFIPEHRTILRLVHLF